MPKELYKILIVDDDKAFLTMIASLVKTLPGVAAVETARSGKECLQKIKSFSPNLVLLDIGMDGMNGLVTLRFVKAMDQRTQIFFLSGHSLKDINDAVGMVKPDGFFTKTQFLDLLNSNLTLEEFLNVGRTAS